MSKLYETSAFQQALDNLNKSTKGSLEYQIRLVYPKIEEILDKGATIKKLVQALNDEGIKISESHFKLILAKIRSGKIKPLATGEAK